MPTDYLVSVKDSPFNALGDGITDDAPAIRAALASVPDGGGTVFVPPGDYRIGSSLVFGQDNVTLTGAGAASVLRLTDSCRESLIITPDRYDSPVSILDKVPRNITISNLVVDGNHNPGGIYGDGIPLYFGVFNRHSGYMTLSGLIVRNWCSDGIANGNGENVIDHLTVENCRIETCGRNGIHVGFATNTVIRGNYVTDCPSQFWGARAGNGIDLEVEGNNARQLVPPGYPGPGPFLYPYVCNTLIEDNILERMKTTTAGDGIAVQPAYGPIFNLTISRNLIRNHPNAIEMTAATPYDGVTPAVAHILIEGNWAVSDDDAVWGYFSVATRTTDVTITGNVDNSIQQVAIYFDLATGVNVSGNTILAYQTGVRIDPGSSAVAMTDNVWWMGFHNVATDGGLFSIIDPSVTGVTASGNTQDTGVQHYQILSSFNVPPTAVFGIADGTVLSAPTPVVIATTDQGVGIARVYFVVDGIPQGHSDTAPYTFVFDPAGHAPGTHQLAALAIDNYANPSVRGNVNILVPTPMSNPIPTTANLRGYWKADAGLFQDTGATTPAVANTAPVALWQDQSGNGFHLTQSVSGQRATVLADSGFKGKPGVHFDGDASQFLTNAAFHETSAVTQGTWVVAYQRVNSPNPIVCTFHNVLSIFESYGTVFFSFDQPGNQFNSYHDNCFHGKLAIARYDGSKSGAARFDYRINRTTRTGTPTGVPDAVTPTITPGLWVGRTGYVDAGIQYLTGTILEAAYFSRDLTDPEVLAIEAYIAETYFAQGNRKVHVLGDSIPTGYPMHGSDGTNWPSRLATLLGAPWTVQNESTVAWQIADLENTGLAQIDPDRDEWRDFDFVVLEAGTNNFGIGTQTPAQAIAEQVISVTNRHRFGYTVFVQTLIPRQDVSTFAGGWTQGMMDAAIASYNALVRSGATGADYVFDLAADSGFVTPVGNPNYAGDLIHLESPGNARVATVLDAQINQLTALPSVKRRPHILTRSRSLSRSR